MEVLFAVRLRPATTPTGLTRPDEVLTSDNSLMVRNRLEISRLRY